MEGQKEGLHRLGTRATTEDLQGICGLHGGFTKTDALQNNKGHL